jgi:murein DD-endopeptidase MepM/ murein hydrolase activator NlpD
MQLRLAFVLLAGLFCFAAGLRGQIELWNTPLYSDPSLVAYYRMEGNANDSKGSNNGTPTNVSFGTAYGKFGQGASFEGNGTIAVPDAASLDPTSAITITMWLYPTGSQPYEKPLVKGNADETGGAFQYAIYTGPDFGNGIPGTIYGQITTDDSSGGAAAITDVTRDSILNTWTLLALTYDGSNVIMYINGVQRGIAASTGNIVPAYGGSPGSLNIGSEVEGNGTYVRGYIDDVAIFSRALSAAEISALYTGNWLTFPLKGRAPGQVSSPLPTPYTAPIISIFDHHMRHPYLADNSVVAFTSEKGSQATGFKQQCYSQGGSPFYVTSSYTGPRSIGNTYLCYDGHPGYDYRADEYTEVYAAVSGTIYFPMQMVGVCVPSAKNPKCIPGQDGPYYLLHAMELIPDNAPNLKIYHLHLSTHPACLSGVPPPGADCDSGQPITVPNPAPGCPAVLPPPASDKTGVHVNIGCLIAYVGESGAKQDGGGPHLHFEVQQVMPLTTTLTDAKLTCLDPLAPAGMACVPIDPYGWYPLAGKPSDPYTTLLGVQNPTLW